MNSNNTIIALAYIRVSNNPLKVFCNLMAYCLYKSPNKKLRNDELIEKVKKEFGLNLPYHLVHTCAKLMKADKQLTLLPHGAGFQLIDINYNITKFEEDRIALKEKEERLLNSLNEYVKNLGKIWTIEEARNNLAKYLVENENAYNLFVNGDNSSPTEEDKKYLSPSWYIKKYISQLIEKKNSEYDYLVEIIRGLMVYIGLNQTNDYEQEKRQKFRGTAFFLDTRLVLRILGYSWISAVESSKELIEIIKNEYEGKISVFEHVVSEVENALRTAEDGLRRGTGVDNPELKMFSSLNKFSADDFRIASNSVRDTIETKLKFKIEPDIDWNFNDTRKYNLDWEKLYKHIKSKHPAWKENTIKNDISSFNHINVLRKGDYSIKYGGKNRLPIFVTTNYQLVKDIYEFVKECINAGDCSSNWNQYNLPIINDNLLMFRLWLPKASNYSNLPVLTLARTVYSAQQSDIEFYERLKATAKDVYEKHKYNIIDLNDERNEKLKEILAIKTDGDLEKISTDMVASSIEELIEFETLANKCSIRELTEKNSEITRTYKKEHERLISSYSRHYVDKLGFLIFLVITAKYWWIISAIIIVAITSIINYITTKVIVNGFWLISLLPIIMPYLLKIVDRLSNRTATANFIESKLMLHVQNIYIKKIENALTDEELIYKQEILDYCLYNSNAFKKYNKENIKIT